jgi:hypothetical protein
MPLPHQFERNPVLAGRIVQPSTPGIRNHEKIHKTSPLIQEMEEIRRRLHH